LVNLELFVVELASRGHGEEGGFAEGGVT
jgi:hypothetical protein